MKVYLKDNEHNRESIIKCFREKGEYRTMEMSCSSSIPLIATYSFLNDEFGGYEEDIERLMKFYGISEVIK